MPPNPKYIDILSYSDFPATSEFTKNPAIPSIFQNWDQSNPNF
jgi:hypothetical protein